MTHPYELTLSEAADAVADRSLSPVELTTSVLGRIGETDPATGAYVTVTAESALADAARAADDIAAGRHLGPLHGIPMALKDLIDTAGVPTTASSLVRADHVPSQDAAVTARLRAAGAVLTGKTHTHEFAYGTTTPQTRNPWDTGRTPGGSSGGSAAAVASGAATFALGTDTGGSIRIPAALTGIVGLKPTYGLVPRRGVASLSWSLDHVGPLTRTVRDAALVLDALAGYDPSDNASIDHPREEYGRLLGRDLKGLRVGVPVNYYFDRVQPDVENTVRAAIDALTGLGAVPVPVEIPMAEYVRAVHWGLMVPEATAYHQDSLRTSPELYTDDVRILLEAGEFVPATDYIRAQRARTLMRQSWQELFERVDVVAAPTVTSTAAPAHLPNLLWADGSEEGVSDSYVRLSAPANLTGLPSLSVPVGFDGDGLPIGMQVIGGPLDEARLIQVGHAYESAHRPVAHLAPLVTSAGAAG
ncbi:amidase [Streptomyces tsukubensis]|uniref:Amidase n=1 Tax=Streptomyces tsukubensis TaxID=83656 RepID=A0A1V4AA49_9ACTN|nr:amidase [Streptomyces tsukubensis]OON80677.1 amidase [Streptomyces tsukubensis]QFR96341.1 Asp-tRNA(Asn)/Glu-tRNA(Gln) amidotransferase GatCAB subunit A [Streptomyces tsukubensis]